MSPKKATKKSKHKSEKNNKDVCPVGDKQFPSGIPESLKDILEKEDLPKDQKIQMMAAVSQTMSFRCQYPPPDVLSEYKQINPALVDTIISQREREQIHRHDMDRADVEHRKGELQYKRRGQTIAALLTPALIILVGVFIYCTTDTENQVEVLKYYFYFILGIAALFLTGRIITGIENIFSKK